MTQLSTRQRDQLPDSAFGYIDRQGERHLPINDEEHIRNAIARFDQTDFESDAARDRARKKVMAAARSHGIEVDDSDDIAKPSN